ncbi:MULTISPECIES: periplasmic nitrate reductase, NapE protein [unclassified Thalassotalea]|uniref:periplasmic nitrate reductase, NapE protein n=1 Tax=unclassified Thalassotalea TaxID=2614972 RepID=UPI001081C7EC|nr:MULTISPECIES: periplasmic nitrate reductase, NapE protein [unclassified Thalassotalea]NMP15039.1 periplasmic nitrate reductase, NapE protein [Thalassotalea sp. Y01]QBY03612.1 periplasmic nitrate reductase, NapE protein [Thalassotalea sp. HSM 43]
MTEHIDIENQKKDERNTFIFLAVFLAPILSVAIVGGLGFAIWISQIIFGPPGVS